MRLIHLAEYGGPYSGSFIPMLRSVMDGARQRGWRGELVFSAAAVGHEWLAELDSDGYTHRIAPSSSRRSLAGWMKQVLGESDDFTILHTHFTRFDIPSVLAGARSGEVRVIWHCHSALASNPIIRLRNEVKNRLFAGRVEAALCVSPDLGQQIVARGMDEEKVEILPNAIDTERFAPAGAEQRAWARSILGLPRDSHVLLHFGWDWHLKGGDRLVDAVRLLREQEGDSIIAVTIGGGEPVTGGPPGLDDAPGVRVLGPMEEVALLYSAADLFISASRAEGAPYAVLEALSSGVPVLASDLPGHALIARDVPDCRLVDMDDPRALADSIRSVLGRSPQERRRLADESREAVTSNFGLQAWARRLFDLYATVIPVT